ncbi:MAG TPA: hypothetical protein VIV60_23630 [Polyangiaceae bacterium]
MQAPTALGIALITSSLAIGGTLGCSASETDNTGPSDAGGAGATVGRGGASATGGAPSSASPNPAAGRSGANTSNPRGAPGGRRN